MTCNVEVLERSGSADFLRRHRAVWASWPQCCLCYRCTEPYMQQSGIASRFGRGKLQSRGVLVGLRVAEAYVWRKTWPPGDPCAAPSTLERATRARSRQPSFRRVEAALPSALCGTRADESCSHLFPPCRAFASLEKRRDSFASHMTQEGASTRMCFPDDGAIRSEQENRASPSQAPATPALLICRCLTSRPVSPSPADEPAA